MNPDEIITEQEIIYVHGGDRRHIKTVLRWIRSY